jgi:hypothetical protein
MNARLYDPVLGRMLSPDNYVSIGGSQGMNRYTYANNNPTKYADLDGNCPMCIGAVIGAGVDIAIQWYTKGEIKWTQVGLAAISGAVGGGVGAWVGGSAALATSSAVVQGAISGAAAGAASGLVSGFMNGQRGWDLAKTVGISAGVGAAVGAGAGYLKGRFFPPKPNAGTASAPPPTDPASAPAPPKSSSTRGPGSVEFGKMEGQMPEINPQTGQYTKITYTPEIVGISDPSSGGGGAFDVVRAFSNAVSPFKGGLLTNAGRAATKHPHYFGFESTEALMHVYRSPEAINNLAASKLETILGQGTMTTGTGGRYPNGWVTFMLSSGEAASWQLDGIFIGFRGSL